MIKRIKIGEEIWIFHGFFDRASFADDCLGSASFNRLEMWNMSNAPTVCRKRQTIDSICGGLKCCLAQRTHQMVTIPFCHRYQYLEGLCWLSPCIRDPFLNPSTDHLSLMSEFWLSLPKFRQIVSLRSRTHFPLFAYWSKQSTTMFLCKEAGIMEKRKMFNLLAD